MDILIEVDEKKSVKHDILGEIIIEELVKEGFSLFYNDVYDYYSTIDFRRGGYRFNVMLIPKENVIECSTSVHKNFFSVLFKKYNKEKLSSFHLLVKSILIQKEIIKGNTNTTDAII